jgi:hypothetical protein
MKKIALAVAAAGTLLLGVSQSAQARDFGAIYQECGLGGAMSTESPGWAVSTNITWDWGTTAIISDVSSPESCKGGKAKTAAYINEAYPKLAQDLSRGEGKHLTALMTLSGCNAAIQPTVARELRSDLTTLVSAPGYAAQSRKEQAAALFDVVQQRTATNSCTASEV